MYRICEIKSTGCLAPDGMQSGGKVDRQPPETFKTTEDYEKYLAECDALEAMRLNTLKQNAINAGYKEDDIEVKWVTDDEWTEIQEANKPIPTCADFRRAKHLPIGDQLDMIYWDKINGTNIWKDYVTKIKKEIPKEII